MDATTTNLGTKHLPDEVVAQPVTVTVWCTTQPDNPRRGLQAIGLAIGDRQSPDLTDQEREYVAAVLTSAARTVREHGVKQPPEWDEHEWPPADTGEHPPLGP